MSFVHLTRRMLLAAGLAGPGLAGPGLASAAQSPPSRTWIIYEARLRARLEDAAGGRFDPATARDLLTLSNAARTEAERPALTWNTALAETARAHAADLAARNYVEHLSPEGFDPSHRLGLIGRRTIGSTSENIAYSRAGQPATSGKLMGLWRKSPRHWENLLDRRHTEAGFGVTRLGDRAYAVGLYARPDGELAQDLAFRVSDEAQIVRSIAALPPRMTVTFVGDPMADSPGTRFGAETLVPPGVHQLRFARRSADRPGVIDLLWGPIFMRS